ncbi:hypothetical protein [Micromonospora sp. DT227]|uniref:hypothetical protein n=1 Tax=Micromonospora sp. DT227 TaxID=3393433 RepID=UPI003CF8D897
MVSGPYPLELRRRAVHAVLNTRDQYPSEWQAILANSERFGIRTAETLRTWVRKAEADGEHDAAEATATPSTVEGNVGPGAAPAAPQPSDIDRLNGENAELRCTIGRLAAVVALLADELNRQIPDV